MLRVGSSQRYPLHWPAGWPRTSWQARKASSPFNTTFDRARRDLVNELRLLGATNVVISTNLPLRLDGYPYADAAKRKIDDPGVAVYFMLRKRPMTMARDGFWSIHDNLRSIGLAITHLRGLERHGGATMMERAFDGFAALPVGESHWDVLGLTRGASRDAILSAYRGKVHGAHPDTGGSPEAFHKLTEARDLALKEIAA